MELLVVVVVLVLVGAIIARIVTDEKHEERESPNESANFYTVPFKKAFHHPTKASTMPLPANPRFYNVGKNVVHLSRECCRFSLLETWDAISEEESTSLGMTVCDLCKEPIAFVYPRSQVYHTTKFCSDAKSIPTQVRKSDAILKGLRPCQKCGMGVASHNRFFN